MKTTMLVLSIMSMAGAIILYIIGVFIDGKREAKYIRLAIFWAAWSCVDLIIYYNMD